MDVYIRTTRATEASKRVIKRQKRLRGLIETETLEVKIKIQGYFFGFGAIFRWNTGQDEQRKDSLAGVRGKGSEFRSNGILVGRGGSSPGGPTISQQTLTSSLIFNLAKYDIYIVTIISLLAKQNVGLYSIAVSCWVAQALSVIRRIFPMESKRRAEDQKMLAIPSIYISRGVVLVSQGV